MNVIPCSFAAALIFGIIQRDFYRGFLAAPLCVATVHDAILPFYARFYPTHRSKLAYAYWLSRFELTLRRAPTIITVSKNAARQITCFCSERGIPEPAIRVIYLGADWSHDSTGETKEDMVIHLASPEPHKKTAQLLRWWKEILGTGRDLPRLRLVGRMDAESLSLATALPNIDLSAPASKGELMRLMSKARALLFPSEIEGFGLPALEAYGVFTPVVYRAGTAVEEVLQGSTGAFHENTSGSFEAALKAVLALELSDVRQIASVLRAKFSWEKCAKETATVYREAMGRKID